MVENFLQEIYRRLRRSQVGIFIDGQSFTKSVLESLPQLKNKLKEIGDIQFAQVMFENNIPEEEFDHLRQSGFTDLVIPGNFELSYLLEVYDIVLEKKIDFIVLGTNREELIPLFTELKKTVTVFAFIEDQTKVSSAFIESFDGILTCDNLEKYTFTQPNFSELDQIFQNGNGHELLSVDLVTNNGDSVDEANIGTFSEEIIEDDLIEEMKKEKL